MKSNNFPFKRIMIAGRPGSGKTTFARMLAKKTGIPLHHLDAYFLATARLSRIFIHSAKYG